MANTANDFKAQVLQAVDIVQLIGQTVALKRRGKDFVGLCPFHQEKTPSFHVSPARQFFYCYGCKAGGNAIDFVIKRDRIEFKEALHQLAERAGLPIPRFGGGGSATDKGERQLLYDANSAACSFFEKLLSDPQQGQAARQYLQQRGFTREALRAFQVGLAADSWDALLTSPLMRKFAPGQLALAGLVKPRENGRGHYDTFRNRVMFPIRDETGRIIAFGGRIMPGSQDPAKYLNSPETPLFSKSRCIYGIDLARQRAVETRTFVVVEGYTDVVMSHQFGVSNVVSILGTALTEQHVSIMRRFADRIVLLFDADTAGDTAVDRSIELLLSQPVEILIGGLPHGVDPDELLLKEGAAGFEQAIASASDALSYKWRQLQRRYAESGDLTSQHKALEEYLQSLANARGGGSVDPLRWGAILTRVSRLTGIPIDQLHRRFRTKPQQRSARPTAATDAPGAGAGDMAERQILGLLLNEPQRWLGVQQHLHPEDFSDPQRRRLAELYWNHQRDEGETVFNEFLALLADSALVELAVSLADEADALPPADDWLASWVQQLVDRRKRQQEQTLALSARINEVDELRRLQERARQPDLRRV